MRILYVAHKYDYGRPELGYSFEHYNFYETLCAMGHEVEYFDLTGAQALRGRSAMNEHLLARARDWGPALMFTFMFEDELEPDVVRQITDETPTVTFNWFGDDHWRFESFTRRWAPCFSWVSTTAESALPKYAAMGYSNVIKTQWAAATSLYRRRGHPLRYDVTFVGQAYGDRPEVISMLRRSGLKVEAWGTGWKVRGRHRLAARTPVVRRLFGTRWIHRAEARTRIGHEQMLEIFEGSRINLNLVSASQGTEAQIKGRTFEVPACGGFLLDGRTEGLDQYFDIGREMVVYEDYPDLIDKARFFLGNESARRRVLDAGHDRVHREHTYEHRFREIFRTMGLPS